MIASAGSTFVPPPATGSPRPGPSGRRRDRASPARGRRSSGRSRGGWRCRGSAPGGCAGPAGRACIGRRPTIGSAAAVVLTTTSASIRAVLSRSKGTTSPPHRRAAASARSGVRLVTTTRPGLRSARCRSVRSAILPAPMTSTVLSANVSKTSRATSTATLAIESLPWSSPVSARTRLPTCRAWRKTAWRIGPAVLLRRPRTIGVLHLPEDLPLAEDEALEARGDAEEVGDGPVVVVVEEVAARTARRARRGTVPVRRSGPRSRGRPRGRPRRRPRRGCRSRGWRTRPPGNSASEGVEALGRACGPSKAMASRTSAGAWRWSVPRARSFTAGPPAAAAACPAVGRGDPEQLERRRARRPGRGRPRRSIPSPDAPASPAGTGRGAAPRRPAT